MAKKKKDQGEVASTDSGDIDRSDTVRHASEEARQAAIAKMKAAQAKAEAASTEPQSTGEGDNSLSEVSDESDQDAIDKRVKKKDTDPKAQKALRDLFGEKPDENATLKNVRIYSPFRVYYDSEAMSVSAVNGTGPFDVLPGHKNFLTLLSKGDIAVRSATGKEEVISIERGVMHVSADQIRVFLDV